MEDVRSKSNYGSWFFDERSDKVDDKVHGSGFLLRQANKFER